MKNTGLEFEILVQSIFQEINNQESVKNINVQQNVSLLGKSGEKHQIDVCWEFEIGGIVYKTIVQAKDWNSNVKKEQVLTFKSVLEDLPHQPRGFMVTKKSFQKGAKQFAKHHGIELFELKEIPKPAPTKVTAGSFADLRFIIEEMCFEIVNYRVRYTNVTLRVNDEQIEALGLPPGTTLNIWSQYLYDSSFQVTETIGKILTREMQLFDKDAKAALRDEKIYRKSLSHIPDHPSYFSWEPSLSTPIKVERIDFTFEITKDDLIKIPAVVPGVTTFILSNILNGSEKKFNVKKDART